MDNTNTFRGGELHGKMVDQSNYLHFFQQWSSKNHIMGVLIVALPYIRQGIWWCNKGHGRLELLQEDAIEMSP